MSAIFIIFGQRTLLEIYNSAAVVYM